MKIFSYDSEFSKFIGRLWDVIVLNFFFTLCSLPVITLGASCIAVYSVTLKMTEERESHIVKAFFRAFRENLKHGILLTLIMLFMLWSAWLSSQLFGVLEEYSVLFLIISIIICFLLLWHFIYVFPIEARYKNSLINNLGNARRIFMAYIGRTVLLLLLVALELFVFFFYCFMNQNSFSTALMILGIIIGPVTVMYTVSGIVMPVFSALDVHGGDTLSDVNPHDGI